jgi:hypothetical protein
VEPARAAFVRILAESLALSPSAAHPGRGGPEVALVAPRKAVTLSQRIIEIVIGRLITDEQFRSEFLADPEKTLLDQSERGLVLSRTEIAALMNTDRTLWARTADAIDARLQKASLRNHARVS